MIQNQILHRDKKTVIFFVRQKQIDTIVLMDTSDFDAFPDKYVFLRNNKHRYLSFKDKNGKQIYLHRHIMKAPKGKVVDHINGITGDIRKQNLRVTTQKINCNNRRKK